MPNTMNNEQRVTEIQSRLNAQLEPIKLEVEDESHLHAGHAGAKGGKGHFRIWISSEQFIGLRPLQKHRLVYDALGEMMDTDIHALSIHASNE